MQLIVVQVSIIVDSIFYIPKSQKNIASACCKKRLHIPAQLLSYNFAGTPAYIRVGRKVHVGSKYEPLQIHCHFWSVFLRSFNFDPFRGKQIRRLVSWLKSSEKSLQKFRIKVRLYFRWEYLCTDLQFIKGLSYQRKRKFGNWFMIFSLILSHLIFRARTVRVTLCQSNLTGCKQTKFSLLRSFWFDSEQW